MQAQFARNLLMICSNICDDLFQVVSDLDASDEYDGLFAIKNIKVKVWLTDFEKAIDLGKMSDDKIFTIEYIPDDDEVSFGV